MKLSPNFVRLWPLFHWQILYAVAFVESGSWFSFGHLQCLRNHAFLWISKFVAIFIPVVPVTVIIPSFQYFFFFLMELLSNLFQRTSFGFVYSSSGLFSISLFSLFFNNEEPGSHLSL